MPYDWVSNYCYVNVEQCREPTSAEMADAIARSQEGIQKFLDDKVRTADDLRKLPEPLRPYAYVYLWDKLSTDGGLVNNVVRFLANQPDPVADILKIERYEISATTDESWLMTSDGWMYVPPFGADILYPTLFNAWQSAPSSNARAAAAFTLGIYEGIYKNFPADQMEFYKWTWENGVGLASQKFNYTRITAGIEYCVEQLDAGADATTMIGEIEKAMTNDVPVDLRARLNYFKAINSLSLGRKDEAINSAMVAWEQGGVDGAQRLFYLLQMADKKLDIDVIANMVDLNVADYEHIAGDDRESADSRDTLILDINILAEMALYAAFIDGAPDEDKLKKLHNIWEKAAFALDESTFSNSAGLWMDTVTGKSQHISAYPAVAKLYESTLGGVWPNLTHAMQANSYILKFFITHAPQSRMMDVAEGYWRRGFESFVTNENLNEIYEYHDISTRIYSKLKIETAEDALNAGTAWSMLAEFLVDHEAVLLEKGIFDDEKELDTLVYQYKGEKAQPLLEMAKKELPYSAEAQNNYTWNAYYLAKYNKKYEVSVTIAEENLKVVKDLSEGGYATKAQYAEAARVWGWNYCEYGHMTVQHSEGSNSGGKGRQAAETTRERLKKVLELSGIYLDKSQDQKGMIDGYSLHGRANYLLARTYEHPLTKFDAGVFASDVPLLSGDAAFYFNETEKDMIEAKEHGDVSGEPDRRMAWIHCRRGNFEGGLKAFRQVLDQGVVKHYDDTLKGMVGCYYLSIVSTRVAIPVTQKNSNLLAMFEIIDKYERVKKDPIAVRQLKRGACQLAEKMGYNQAPEYCKDLLKGD